MHREELDARIKALALLTTLGLIALGLWFFCSPPSGTWDAVARLDPKRYPDPADRIKGIDRIKTSALDGSVLSGYQKLQERGCKDPDPKVRVAALDALGAITAERPEMIVRSGLVAEAVYLDTGFLTELGKTDPAPEVRIAVGRFWEIADVLWKTGVEALGAILDGESDKQVAAAVRESFARRLERSSQRGKIKADRARELTSRYKLRDLTLK
jgi:hypothetical protein